MIRNKIGRRTPIENKCMKYLFDDYYCCEENEPTQIYGLIGAYIPPEAGACRECEALHDKEHSRKKMEKEFTFSDTIEFHTIREYKEINPERILDIEALDIIPYGTDEIFVRLMDYKDTWLSNYGRCITKAWNVCKVKHMCFAWTNILEESREIM